MDVGRAWDHIGAGILLVRCWNKDVNTAVPFGRHLVPDMEPARPAASLQLELPSVVER